MSQQLSNEGLEDLRKTFNLFDVDGDGKITLEELENVMEKFTGVKPSRVDLEDMLREADYDSNGTIEFNEFIKLMSSKVLNVETDDSDMREAFKIFDRDGNGFIDHNELKSVMAKLGEVLTDSQISQMMKEADTDQDGKINFEEFTRMMSKQ